MGVTYGQCSEICGALHGYMPLCISYYYDAATPCSTTSPLLSPYYIYSLLVLLGDLLY